MLNGKYKLNNGVEIPALGLGTWFIENGRAAQAVRDAVGLGYRHIDTAQAYANEEGVGEGIRTCGVKREELFVTTKLAAEIKDYKGAVTSIDGSLKTMGLDYIDLMLIHSPQPWADFRGGRYSEGNAEVWSALEEAYKAGKLRAIGVSNFEKEDIDNILSHCSIPPTVNQLLAHIGNTPFELTEYSQDKGMLVEAYSPVAHGEILKNAEVAAVAAKYGVSVARLCIKYCLQLGLLPLPKTADPAHMKENAELGFVISAEDMEKLKKIEHRDYGGYAAFPVFGKAKP